jgi:hypothetical protein
MKRQIQIINAALLKNLFSSHNINILVRWLRLIMVQCTMYSLIFFVVKKIIKFLA